METCTGADNCAEGVPSQYQTSSCVVTVAPLTLTPSSAGDDRVSGTYTDAFGGSGTWAIAVDRDGASVESRGLSRTGGYYFIWRGRGLPDSWDLSANFSISPSSGDAVAHQLEIVGNTGTGTRFGSKFDTYSFTWGGGGSGRLINPSGQLNQANGARIPAGAVSLTQTDSVQNPALNWSVLAPPNALRAGVTATGGVTREGMSFRAEAKYVSCVQIERSGTWNDVNGDGIGQVGETVSYDYIVRNTGPSDLRNVSVSDGQPGLNLSGSTIPVLPARATDSTTFSAVYRLTEADLLAGGVDSRASVRATGPLGNTLTGVAGEAIPIVVPVPVAEPDVSEAHSPGETVEDIDVLGNDPTVDLDARSVRIIGADPTTGELVVEDEGTWSVDPTTGTITFVPVDDLVNDPTPVTYTVEGYLNQRTNPVEVLVDYTPVLEEDESLGNAPASPVTVDVLENEPTTDVDPASVAIVVADVVAIDEETGEIDPESVSFDLDVAGQGTWTVNPANGEITFTPSDGFGDDPTPIRYTALDREGNVAEPVEVRIEYAPLIADDRSLENPRGSTVSINVVANDPTSDIDPTTVRILGAEGNVRELSAFEEGLWTVDDVTGAITFTPEPGLSVDPVPILYVAMDEDGFEAPPAEVAITYIDVPSAFADESLNNQPGTTLTIDVLANDPTLDLDPASVMILDERGNPTSELTVVREGTWNVNPTNGEITFAPVVGFRGNPTVIEYVAVDVLGIAIAPTPVVITYVAPSAPPVLSFNGTGLRAFLLIALIVLGSAVMFALSQPKTRISERVIERVG